MQLVFVLLTALLLAVSVFAIQNPDVVSVRFLVWEMRTSVAVLALGATTAGAVIGGLLGLASRLRRWQRARAAGAATPAPGDRPGDAAPE